MRIRTPFVFTLAAIAVAAVVLALAGSANVDAAPAAEPDDEIAYIGSDSFITITDPRAAPGHTAFTWRSPSGGYTDLAVIDANGDGVEEIVAIGSGTARILVPGTQVGGSTPSFEKIFSGYHYNLVAVGDTNADGHQDIILQRTIDGGDASTVEVWLNGGDGRTWTEDFDLTVPYGAAWLRIEAGDVDGLEGDEIVMMRIGPDADHADERIIIYKRAAAGNYAALLSRVFDWPWIDLAVGNTVDAVNGGIAEIVTSRDVTGLATVHSFQYSNGSISAAPNSAFSHWPPFTDIALGDVNASGDMELFLLRDPRIASGTTVLAKNFGSDTISASWISGGLKIGQDWREIETGDTDGDGKAEVVIAKATGYSIYTEPSAGIANSGVIPASLKTWPVTHAFDTANATTRVAFKLGNFDGDGVSTEPPHMEVSTNTITFEMRRAEANPDAQTFEVTNAGGGAFAVNVDARTISGGDWLEVTPFEDNAPATFTVSVKNTASLSPNTYDATITVEGTSSVAVENSPQTITVRLIVRPTGPQLGVDPAMMDFSYDFGGARPNPQTLSLSNIGDGGRQFFQLTATTDDGGDWINLDKRSGFTDETVEVSIDLNGLLPGDYAGSIEVDAGDIEGSPQTIPVSLTITASGMVVTPTEISLLAIKGMPDPDPASISIQNSVDEWYAYAVPSGDWWNAVKAMREQNLSVTADESGFTFSDPAGSSFAVSALPWVLFAPEHGVSPGTLQVSIDASEAPLGYHYVTVIIDGGPHSINRFQGVDATMLVTDQAVWLPLLVE